MTKNRIKNWLQILSIVTLIGLFVSCTTEIGITKNPEVTVNYIEQPNQENLANMVKQYRSAVSNYKGTMPGLHADYAILLMKIGKEDEAIKQFNLEMKLYPESQKYVEFLKKTVKK